MHAVDRYADGLACLDILVVILGVLLGHGDGHPIAAHDLIRRAVFRSHAQDVVAGNDLCGVNALCSGQGLPCFALIMRDRSGSDLARRSRRKVQFAAFAGEVQGVKFGIPALLCICIVGNILRTLDAAACKAVDAECSAAVRAADRYNDKTGARRVGCAVSAVILTAAQVEGIIGHLDDRGAFLKGGQRLPRFAARHGVRLVRQTDNAVFGLPDHVKVEVGLHDPVVVADRNELPGAVCLQDLGVACLERQMVLRIDIEQHAVIRKGLVRLARCRVIHTRIRLQVALGVGYRYIFCGIARLDDVILIGHAVDRRAGDRSGSQRAGEVVGAGAVAVVFGAGARDLRIIVIIADQEELCLCAGGSRHRLQIVVVDLCTDRFGICRDGLRARSGFVDLGILRDRRQRIGLADRQQEHIFIRTACRMTRCIAHGNGSIHRISEQIGTRYLHAAQRDLPIRRHRDRLSQTVCGPEREIGLAVDRLYGVNIAVLFLFQFLAGYILAVFKFIDGIEYRIHTRGNGDLDIDIRSLQNGQGHRIGGGLLIACGCFEGQRLYARFLKANAVIRAVERLKFTVIDLCVVRQITRERIAEDRAQIERVITACVHFIRRSCLNTGCERRVITLIREMQGEVPRSENACLGGECLLRLTVCQRDGGIGHAQ